jgi:hypothetical protein
MTKRTLKEAWHARKIDMIQERPDSDFGVNFSTIQFYTIKHNSKLNYWIEPKLYQKIPELCFYVGVKFQVNRSSGKTCNIGQNRLYEFCYLLFLTCGLPIWQGSFSYKDVKAFFGNLLVLQWSLMGYNIIFKYDKNSLMFQNPFSYKDSLIILATQGKKGWWYLMTY